MAYYCGNFWLSGKFVSKVVWKTFLQSNAALQHELLIFLCSISKSIKLSVFFTKLSRDFKIIFQKVISKYYKGFGLVFYDFYRVICYINNNSYYVNFFTFKLYFIHYKVDIKMGYHYKIRLKADKELKHL